MTKLKQKAFLNNARRPEMDFFALLGSGFVQVGSIRETKLSNTDLVTSKHIKREKASLPVDVRTSLLQGHPATFFCKITVRRSKYCLEISKACEKLKKSG